MKKNIYKATLLLSLGGFICKFLGAFYRIPLSNILGAEGMGIYQLIFPIFTFSLVIVSGGLPLVLSKSISASRAEGRYDKISVYFSYAIIFSILVSLFLSVFILIFAKQLALFQGIGNAFWGYYIIVPAIFFGCLISVFKGFYQGFEDMKPTFYSQIIEQILKLLLGLALAYYLLKYGLLYAIYGALFAVTFSELVTFIYFLIILKIDKKRKAFKFTTSFKNFKNYKNDVKQLFGFTFFISLSAIILPLSYAVNSLISIKLLMFFGHAEAEATALFGIQTGMVAAIINFPSIISVALATTLVPSLTYYLEKNDWANISLMIKNVFKTLWIVCLPCMAGIFVLSEGIISLFFAGAIGFAYREIAAMLMKISSLSVLFISFSQITTAILQISKKQSFALISLVSFFVINLAATIFFVSRYSIVGLAISGVIAYGILALLNILFLSKSFGAHMSLKDIFLPVIFSALMGMIVSYSYKNISPNLLLNIFLSVIIGVLFYFILLFLFKVLEIKKIKINFNKLKK